MIYHTYLAIKGTALSHDETSVAAVNRNRTAIHCGSANATYVYIYMYMFFPYTRTFFSIFSVLARFLCKMRVFTSRTERENSEQTYKMHENAK